MNTKDQKFDAILRAWWPIGFFVLLCLTQYLAWRNESYKLEDMAQESVWFFPRVLCVAFLILATKDFLSEKVNHAIAKLILAALAYATSFLIGRSYADYDDWFPAAVICAWPCWVLANTISALLKSSVNPPPA